MSGYREYQVLLEVIVGLLKKQFGDAERAGVRSTLLTE